MRPVFYLMLLMVVGCHLPGQMVWSPDATKAAYRTGDQMMVVDDNGKLVSQKFKSYGGMAWTADSKTLYFAQAGAENPAEDSVQFQYIDRWAPRATPDVPGKPEADEHASLVCSMVGNEKPRTLFYLPPKNVWHLALSPDAAWLAVLSDNDGSNMLYAFHLPSKQLFVVSRSCAVGMSFTPAGKLVYIEAEQHAGKLEGQRGTMIEATLDPEAEQLNHKELLQILPDRTGWLSATSDAVLFTSVPETYPSQISSAPVSAKLYQYRRTDNSLCVIADDVGPLFLLSPDAKQILIEKLMLSTDHKITKRELAIIKPNGSDLRVLQDITALPNLPLWPSWKSNDEIVFTVPKEMNKPVASDKDDIVRFDIAIYKLNDGGAAQQTKVLSTDWPDDMKPGYKVDK